MSQDIVSDTLNQIMNAKRAGKKSVVVHRHSKLLLDILKMAQDEGYIESFKTEGNDLEITIGKLHECKSIKPRFNVSKDQIERYIRRYLPGIGVGFVIISTNQGLLTNEQAMEKEIGGALIAYFY